MAHYFVYPDKDAMMRKGAFAEGTSSQKNYGLDEILEIGKTFTQDSNVVNSTTRALIKFSITEISKSVSDGSIGSDAEYYLNLYDAGSFELMRDNSLYGYAASQSWDEGSGRLSDMPQSEEGVSWRYRTGVSESLEWKSGSQNDWGGTYYSGSGYEASQSFNKDESHDMRMNVTDIVTQWLNGSVSNDGFLIKMLGIDEVNTARYGLYKFFSSDTHTVYAPRLEAVWDDATWSTGSLTAIDTDELGKLQVYMTSFKGEYKKGALTKIRVHGRQRYPARTFSTTSSYLDVQYLPSASCFYSIVDSKTEDVIIPFGSSSKLSCDTTGNFFRLRTEGLYPERFYRVLFKVASGSGITQSTEYYDGDHSFKVVR